MDDFDDMDMDMDIDPQPLGSSSRGSSTKMSRYLSINVFIPSSENEFSRNSFSLFMTKQNIFVPFHIES